MNKKRIRVSLYLADGVTAEDYEDRLTDEDFLRFVNEDMSSEGEVAVERNKTI